MVSGEINLFGLLALKIFKLKGTPANRDGFPDPDGNIYLFIFVLQDPRAIEETFLN